MKKKVLWICGAVLVIACVVVGMVLLLKQSGAEESDSVKQGVKRVAGNIQAERSLHRRLRRNLMRRQPLQCGV